MTIEYLEWWDLALYPNVELVFYDLSDLFKITLACFWNKYEVKSDSRRDFAFKETFKDVCHAKPGNVVKGCSDQQSKEFDVLLRTMLDEAINSFTFREYRALAFLFLDLVMNKTVSQAIRYNEDFVLKLELIHAFWATNI